MKTRKSAPDIVMHVQFSHKFLQSTIMNSLDSKSRTSPHKWGKSYFEVLEDGFLQIIESSEDYINQLNQVKQFAIKAEEVSQEKILSLMNPILQAPFPLEGIKIYNSAISELAKNPQLLQKIADVFKEAFPEINTEVNLKSYQVIFHFPTKISYFRYSYVQMLRYVEELK